MTAFVAFLSAIPAFIQSLPYLFQVALKVMTLVEKFISWSQKREFNQFLTDCEATIDKLESAKTPEEKRNAARDLVGIIRKLG